MSVIFGRNFSPIERAGKPKPYHSFFTLALSETSPPFYTSEVVLNSTNPTWKAFDLTGKKDALLSRSSDCVIRVWSGFVETGQPIDTTAFQLLIKWDLNLYGLSFLKRKIESTDQLHFPLNSLALKLADGFYWVSNSPEPKGLDLESAQKLSMLRVDRNKVKRSYSRSSLMRINTLQQAINIAHGNIKSVTERTEAFMRTAVLANHGLKASVEKLRLLIAKRRQDEAAQRRLQKAEATELQVARAEFAERERVVRQSHGALAGAKAELKEMSTKLTDRRHMLWQAQSMVTVRQTRIILELSQIFPLLQAEGPNGNLSICNLTLPNSDYAGCDEEAVSTALGYVAHLTFMISKYLEVPFRFPISPMCSRSHIKDDISTSTPDNPKERTYPLYSVKKERLQFDYGVFLLNKNIQQLLNHCMLQPADARNTLPNLRMLLVHYINLHQQHTAATGMTSPMAGGLSTA